MSDLWCDRDEPCIYDSYTLTAAPREPRPTLTIAGVTEEVWQWDCGVPIPQDPTPEELEIIDSHGWVYIPNDRAGVGGLVANPRALEE